MSMEPRRPEGYPTEEIPTYRKVAAHPEPAERGGSPVGTGELPVTGAPITSPHRADSPRGPHVPTVVRGLLVLVAAAVVFVWRLVDDPDWTVVGIGIAVAIGALLLLAAVVSMVIRRVQSDRDFDRMLSGS